MSNAIGKNLHLCFSIIKRPQPQLINNSPKPNLDLNSNQHSPLQSPITTKFTKTYNSLFEDPLTTASPSSVDTNTDVDEALLGPKTPDLTAAYASRRFFISSPGRSNSIVDSPSSSSPEDESNHPPVVVGAVAVETYSPDPYVDFRRSMQDMVEAREVPHEDIKGAWEYLQELLLSYLGLNPKSTHKYIVRAFVDLVVSSMSPINNNNNNNNNGPSSIILSPYFTPYNCGVIDCGNNNNNNNNSSYVEIFNNVI